MAKMLRSDMEMACALAAYFRDKMKEWGEPVKSGVVFNNTFEITDERAPQKRYRVTVEEMR